MAEHLLKRERVSLLATPRVARDCRPFLGRRMLGPERAAAWCLLPLSPGGAGLLPEILAGVVLPSSRSVRRGQLSRRLHPASATIKLVAWGNRLPPAAAIDQVKSHHHEDFIATSTACRRLANIPPRKPGASGGWTPCGPSGSCCRQ